MGVIKFLEKDLLNAKEIKSLITSIFTNDKAITIASKLRNYFIIHNDKYYRYDIDNILYIEEDADKKYINTMIMLFLEKSFKNLPKAKREGIELKHKKTYYKIFTHVDIDKYKDEILTYLTNNDINFSDPHLLEIHFKNGFYDFRTGTFLKRIDRKHFINVFINRDYDVVSDSKKTIIMDIIKQIYPIEEDRNYLLMTYGIALTGLACSDQTMLFLLGMASSGKSAILELCKASLNDTYVLTLNRETFTRGYSKIDKVLNTYITKQCIRITHINEPADTKMDESLFKDHCDGNIQTTSLFKDGANTFHHHSKMIFTSNTFPSIKIDSGSFRRIDAYTHTSSFVKTDKANLIDHSKHIYAVDKDLIANIKKDNELLNAFFSIIVEYGQNWFNKTKIYTQTKNFIDTKNIVISTNDVTQDFIDKCLKRTGKESDRIGKDEMYELFKINFPRSFMTSMQLLSSLKQKDIKYNSDFRHKQTGIKGCYIELVIKGDNLPVSIFDSTDNGIDKTDKSVDVVKEYKLQIEQLKIEHDKTIKDMKTDYENQINALKKQLENIKPIEIIKEEIIKPIEIVKEEIIKPIEIIEQEIIKKSKKVKVSKPITKKPQLKSIFKESKSSKPTKQQDKETVILKTEEFMKSDIDESFKDMAEGLLNF